MPSGQLREGTLLCADLFHGVAWQFQRESGRQRCPDRVCDCVSTEQWERVGGMTPCARRWRMAKVGEPRTEQAVANLQPVIQKTERPIRGEGTQPQRQARELDSHGVEVHAIQTALRNRSPDDDALPFIDVARVTNSVTYQ